MVINKQESDIYIADKRVMPRGENPNSGGYVTVPSWLIGKTISYEHETSLEKHYKKVIQGSEVGLITFPTFYVGLRITIKRTGEE